jgi:hypothetical protein
MFRKKKEIEMQRGRKKIIKYERMKKKEREREGRKEGRKKERERKSQ